jgi:tRNA (adenine-N(1)-)-methyltransferase non-catalytic subunit
MANVTANSHVLVVDKIGGILTGAIAERLGGSGYVCNTYRGVTPPSIDIVRIFNFSSEICKRIVQSPLQDLCVVKEESDQIKDANNIKNQTDEAMLSPCASPTQVCNDETMDKDTSTKIIIACKKATKAGQKASSELIKLWKDNGFSSLVIAAADIVDVWGFAKEVIPLLSFSAPFAIYHQCQQPLTECMHELQKNKIAINLQLSEPWLREYQVLPSRTHPMMQMSGSGGYILSGTRITIDSN